MVVEDQWRQPANIRLGRILQEGLGQWMAQTQGERERGGGVLRHGQAVTETPGGTGRH